ncbi:hypothetical protein B0H67DRAFT_583514 [Lasiosphaeris hirsuta]|uniref:Uncharacterized protein n=1 Tax=Lasiosphaeris hirsuta TaxID=260670 RepID=A0AA40DRQ1_9PEZI|nr:hypothetical protein B0H67DRAFT_583514 [Lasiosphaeris hirsuta]
MLDAIVSLKNIKSTPLENFPDQSSSSLQLAHTLTQPPLQDILSHSPISILNRPVSAIPQLPLPHFPPCFHYPQTSFPPLFHSRQHHPLPHPNQPTAPRASQDGALDSRRRRCLREGNGISNPASGARGRGPGSPAP